MRELAQGPEVWAVPWPCLAEFYGVVTHPRVFRPATTIAEAIEQIDAWAESPTFALLAEPDRHWPTLKRLLSDRRIVGPAIHDARIAALCIQHAVRELWSADRDFSRYPGLRVINPLIAK